MNCQTVAEAVKVGNEYLQVQNGRNLSPAVRKIDEEGEKEDTIQVNKVADGPLQSILQALQQLGKELAEIKRPPPPPPEWGELMFTS